MVSGAKRGNSGLNPYPVTRLTWGRERPGSTENQKPRGSREELGGWPTAICILGGRARTQSQISASRPRTPRGKGLPSTVSSSGSSPRARSALGRRGSQGYKASRLQQKRIQPSGSPSDGQASTQGSSQDRVRVEAASPLCCPLPSSDKANRCPRMSPILVSISGVAKVSVS